MRYHECGSTYFLEYIKYSLRYILVPADLYVSRYILFIDISESEIINMEQREYMLFSTKGA
jgi:hypothetical protein